MTAFPTKQVAALVPVFDLSNYDRTPQLSASERIALSQLVEAFNAKRFHWPDGTDLVMERLLRPLNDVLARTETRHKSCVSIIRLMIRWMNDTQQTYWNWSSEVWYGYMTNDLPSEPVRTDFARPAILAFAYCLGGLRQIPPHYRINRYHFASLIFGHEPVLRAVELVVNTLVSWGYGGQHTREYVRRILSVFFLQNGSPDLASIPENILDQIDPREQPVHLYKTAHNISRVLVSLGILTQPIRMPLGVTHATAQTVASRDVSDTWLAWCQRWKQTSTLAPRTVQGSYYNLLKVGRWLQAYHPTIDSPEQWDRDLAMGLVVAIHNMKVGECVSESCFRPDIGKPLASRTQIRILWTMVRFMRDLQEWGWIPRRFNPERCFRAPRSVIADLVPRPRILDEALWAKLIWAGLNLQPEDLQSHTISMYPFEMVRAIAVVWLFSGLRNDEIRRLRVGCIQLHLGVDADPLESEGATCLLDVPAHKTGGQFIKPVARLLGDAIRTWETKRPQQPSMIDRRTREKVDFLFLYRGKPLGDDYINHALIPMLCEKVGLPCEDHLGRITSHRARATIATQLGNAREPMSLLELQEWLGHRTPLSTQHYVKVLPQRLTRAYSDAGYLDRNIRAIQVLVDQEAIRSGAASLGEPWKYYDLGHGHCTYDFFDQCPHRMACARCDFYLPKDSAKAQLLQAKSNLLRMKQEIPLLDDELAALEEDLAAIDRLCDKLADVATPSGLTPRQINTTGLIQISDIP